MRKTAHVQRRFDTEHRILDKLSKILPVGQPISGMSYPSLAEQIGEQAHAVLLAKKTMEDANILRTTLMYPKGKSGRVSVWELTMPPELAHKEMSKEHELQLLRPSRKAERRQRVVQTGEPEALRPVEMGRPEDGEALIRDARAYVARLLTAREYVQNMRAQGIEVRDDAVTFRRDDRMETLAQVLPYVDELTRERDRLADQLDRFLHRKRGTPGGSPIAAV
jgi:hypothetical protein